MAMRNPISRVRSVTETSMMFMIPMPPTSSDTPAMPARSAVMVCVVSRRTLAISSIVRTMKSSWSPGWILCRTRSSAVMASATRVVSAADVADTVICPRKVVPLIFFITVVYGT
jgi:hypothetical protein